MLIHTSIPIVQCCRCFSVMIIYPQESGEKLMDEPILHVASSKGSANVVQVLLKHGVDPNERDKVSISNGKEQAAMYLSRTDHYRRKL